MMRNLRLSCLAPRFLGETRGAAAAEFVLWMGLLSIPTANVVDLGMYGVKRMQVASAAEAAVQAAWHLCNQSSASTALPLASCSGVYTVMKTAAQSGSLGTNVSLGASAIIDSYYCSNGSGALVHVATTDGNATTAPQGPGNCSSVIAGSITVPGEYVQATASYPFTSFFPNATVTSFLPKTITQTAWLRLDK
ncbi:hypothetical protein [Phenylobacterium montanum]|uniref:Uncharacterized protein n=1 Tax=Phenylobacterium montanum TaxID=2823693 RepID=A0A975IV90_9CAUL|nr:hypothetical protein [Caulobacter sp. S6]QUD88593.1 hypothetical protein KCG34_01490 [Caulobacter sp. S6]